VKPLLFTRSLLFYIGYFFATMLISILCMVMFWLLPLEKRFALYSLWCRFVLFWLRVTCGIQYQIQGLDNIPDEPVVVLSTHQSAWETIFLYYTLAPVCPILKKELLDIPFWGWAVRLQQPIAIDRSKPREAGRALLTQGKDRLQRGMSVVIFPEGTRSAPGTIRPLNKGGAKLATSAEALVLPVIHNAGWCWPARTIYKYPGTITVRFGDPMVGSGKNAAELTDEYAAWLQNNLEVITTDGRR